jgi:hypothetical protein
MPALRNAKRRVLPATALLGLLAAAQADFSVSDVQARIADGALEVSGELGLALTPKVEEALAKGIPLEVVIGLRLQRLRPWLWNERVAEWTLKRRIRYHALSGQYLVSTLDDKPEPGEAVETYISASEATRQLGTLTALRLALPEPVRADQDYELQVRVYLDLESLPTPLQPVAYTSLAWHLNSGWSTWTVVR